MFQSDELPANYTRTLVDVGFVDSFVYHPDTEDPYVYDSQALFPDISSKDDSNDVQDNTELDGKICHTNSECRLSIPKTFLKQMELESGDKVYLQKDVDKKVLKISGISLTDDSDEITVNSDGRVRISNTMLYDALGPIGIYRISINKSQTPTDVVISVVKVQ